MKQRIDEMEKNKSVPRPTKAEQDEAEQKRLYILLSMLSSAINFFGFCVRALSICIALDLQSPPNSSLTQGY